MTVKKKLVKLVVGVIVLVAGYFGASFIELDADAQSKAVDAICNLATCTEE